MRVRAEEHGISVHAISGTHAVVFGLDVSKESRTGLLGFAIGWQPIRNGGSKWLRGFKFFEETMPYPRPGDRGDTRDHPIQSFLWGHYSAAPGQDYRYIIRPVYGSPKRLLYGHDVVVKISTSPVDLGHHAVFFNRGAIASQEFADRFGNRGPLDVNDSNAEHVAWLSRGLLRGALDFIGLAKDSSWGLRVAAFRLTYHPVLEAIVAAAKRGVDVRVIYEGGNRKIKGVVQPTSTAIENRAAIITHHLNRYKTVSLIERRNCRSDPNNNFIVLLEKDRPLAVWTGRRISHRRDSWVSVMLAILYAAML